MVYRFFGLRLDAVVRGDYYDYDIGNSRSARPHRGKRLVAGSIDKGNILTVFIYHISAYVLRDAARLARSHASFADIIE